ncbi:MAG: hypothetical protein NVSMB25_07480 [Thermoleophilaceae bacterium]
MRRLMLLLVIAGGALALASSSAQALPPIKHVFTIVLENENYQSTFGPGSKAPYLATQLPSQGQLLPNYYGTGHLSLDDYISIVSGQAPNADTQADCQFYTDFLPGLAGPDGQVVGQGCVYPGQVKTVADQLETRGLAWKGYMEDMGNSPPAPQTCRHPAIGARDDTQSPKPGDQYAVRHNPFVYFHSIIDRPSCQANDVPLDRLQGDLASAPTTPAYAFIVPNLCHDGHDAPCVNGEPGGLVSADAFLKTWVPRITGSPAFADGGLLIVTFDESGNDSTACCNEQSGPNTPNPGGPQAGPGGGRIGAVLLSPYIQPGSVNQTPYNHYGLLRSVEDLFGLGHLGYAGQSGLRAFGDDVFNRTASRGNRRGGGGRERDDRRTRLRIRLAGIPHGCTRRRFRVHVRVSGDRVRSVEAKLDGRRVRITRRSLLGFNIHTDRLRRNGHVITVRAVDGAGRSLTRRVRFHRCTPTLMR